MFVVVLVIAMLTGIGLFAARASSQAIAASGFERQATQTHQVTEFAMLTTAAELSTSRREAYVRQMMRSPDPGCPEYQKVTNYTCYRFGYLELNAIVKGGTVGEELVRPAAPAKDQAGSLGKGDLQADFEVKMTDLGPATPPVAGMDLTSAGAAYVHYVAVTLTATGQVRPRAPAVEGKTDLASAGSASNESLRAHLVVGPLPKL